MASIDRNQVKLNTLEVFQCDGFRSQTYSRMCEIQERFSGKIKELRNNSPITSLPSTIFGEYVSKCVNVPRFQKFNDCPIIGQGTRSIVISTDSKTVLKIPRGEEYFDHIHLEWVVTQQLHSLMKENNFPSLESINITLPKLVYIENIPCLKMPYIPGASLKKVFIMDFLYQLDCLSASEIIDLSSGPNQRITDYLERKGISQDIINQISIYMYPTLFQLLIENNLIDADSPEVAHIKDTQIIYLGKQSELIKILGGEDMINQNLLKLLMSGDKVRTSIDLSKAYLGPTFAKNLTKIVAFFLNYEQFFPDLIRSNIIVSNHKSTKKETYITLIDMF